MPIAAGTRFGPYEILALVGAGAMGEVYRARDPRLGRDVALKILPAAFCADRDRLRRFEQEAKAAGALNHPNIVAIHDVGTEQGQPFLVSELLEGENLRQRLTRGALPPRRAVEIAAQLAHGLAAAHARGILHRDLKPENLFLTRDGRAKIPWVRRPGARRSAIHHDQARRRRDRAAIDSHRRELVRGIEASSQTERGVERRGHVGDNQLQPAVVAARARWTLL